MEDDDTALEESQFALYEESQKCINEGVAVIREITGSGDTIMGDQTFHKK
jgi:hypothetical protein